MKRKFHKSIRLKKELYQRPEIPCSVTICSKDKKRIFCNRKFTEESITLLKKMTGKNEIPIYAYCFMPDHLHLLLSASLKKGIITFVREFKGLSTKIAWKYSFEGTIWQKSFYDHFLRKEEDLQTTCLYILNNPVRAGLVQNYEKYPFSGSLVFDL
jgi:putative transposase